MRHGVPSPACSRVTIAGSMSRGPTVPFAHSSGASKLSRSLSIIQPYFFMSVPFHRLVNRPGFTPLHDTENARRIPLVAHGEALTKPVLAWQFPTVRVTLPRLERTVFPYPQVHVYRPA